MTNKPDLSRNSQIVRLDDGVLPALPYSKPFDPPPPESAEDLRAVELLDYWRVIIDRKRLVFGCGLAGALIGFLSLIPQPYVFKAKTRVELQGVNGNFMGIGQVDPQDNAFTSADSVV